MGQFKGETMLDIIVVFMVFITAYGVCLFFKDLYEIYRYKSGKRD